MIYFEARGKVAAFNSTNAVSFSSALYDEAVSVATRVDNPDCSALNIKS